MAERVIGAREANQQFSALLAATEKDGLTVVITRRGRVVARLVPESSQATEADVGDRSIDTLFARYSRPMGGKPFSRDDLHDRGELGS
jgi:prevent-host-death family protein